MRITGGKFRGRKLHLVGKISTRETSDMVKVAVFNMLFHIHGRVLDLYAGAGSYGIEALSRGATHVVFVDQDKDAASTIKHNLSMINLEDQANVYVQTDETFINRLQEGETFDFIFLDPPYEDERFDQIIPLLTPYVAGEGVDRKSVV